MKEISENTVSREKEVCCWAAHGAAQHADGVGNVGTRPQQLRVRWVTGFSSQCGVDKLGQIVRRGGVCAARGDSHPVGHEGVYEMLNVGGLRERDVVVLPYDIHVEQVGDGPLVFHVPSVREGVGEVSVEGAGRVVGGEDARIRRGLDEAKLEKPREQGALPPAAGLSHAVNRLLNATNARAPIRAEGGVPGGRVAVDNLPVLQLALEVRRHKVPAPHVHAVLRSHGGKRAKGGGAHRSAKGLVIINPRCLSAPLNT
eukprot:6212733-Pleurochrysis_carterae.AAC.4